MRTQPALAMSTALDLIAIGRVSVDLCGQQIGSRLEDVSTFAEVPLVRGLVAAGSILTGGAQAWLAGEKSDETSTVEIAARFAALVEVWSTVRDPRLDRAERSAN